MALIQIKSIDIMDWKRSLEYTTKNGKEYPTSPLTISAKLSAIRKFYGCFKNSLNVNIIADIKNPKIDNGKEKEKIVLNDNEYDTLFDNLNSGVGSNRAIHHQKNYYKRDMAIINLLSDTGIRNDALVKINVSDLDLQNKTVIENSKGDKTRIKDLTDEACYYLAEYLRERLQKNVDTDALFLSNRNKRIETQTVRIMIKKYSSGINKRVTPHVFRKTCGTRLYNTTHDIVFVADVLDHSDINTTRKAYINVDKGKRKAVINSANLHGNKHNIKT
jgi:site-specific recombinase XerD